MACDQMPAETMWKALWKKWTIDKPAIFGDWLWEIFVVRLAAFLDRLTLRKIIAFAPIVILILAYYHRIPIPPELMLVGDLLAYVDIFAVLLLLGVLARVATVLYVIKQAAARAARLAGHFMTTARRLDFRRRREHSASGRKRLTGRPKSDDGEPVIMHGFVWA